VSSLITFLLSLPPAAVLLAALLLPAVEASALVGLVVPGETAVFVAGLTAHGGRLPLGAVVAAAAAGATLGDQVGFRLGRRLGPRLLDRLPRRLHSSGRVDRVTRLVSEHGAWAVLAGRWTAVLRALVPGLAGASGMGQRRFTVFNVIGGVSWAAAVAALGYGAGAAYPQVLQSVHHAGELLVAAGLVAVGVSLLVRRLRRPRVPMAAGGAE
jgi:undecaprenyl-diphosphatase